MKIAFVTSTGGHLSQLVTLRSWWQDHERYWVVLDRSDVRSALPGEQIITHYYPTTRNIRNLLRNFWLAVKVFRRQRPDLVVSTGAGVNIPFWVIAKVLRIPTIYIEVIDRLDTRTMTGRVCKPITSEFLVQWPEQQQLYPGATLIGRLLPDIVRDPDAAGGAARSGLVVTVGTDVHPFDRLVEWTETWVRESGYTGPVTIQYGHSKAPTVPGGSSAYLDRDELTRLMGEAEAVITHGGPASIAESWQAGILPIVVPREHGRGEHVDDHQVLFSARLGESESAVVARDYATFAAALTARAGGGFVPVQADPAPIERATQQVAEIGARLTARR